MSEPALKCENSCASFKQTWTKNCLLLLKWPIIAFPALGGNLDFLDFLQKKFYNII